MAAVTDLVVRPGQPTDAAAIAAIGQLAFPPTYAGAVEPAVIATVVEQLYTADAVRASIAVSAADPRSRFLVAERAGEVVGFIDYDELGPEPELHRIYLHPDAIGTGAGSALIKSLHAVLATDAPYVLLVAAANSRAIAFYQRHGLAIRDSVDAVPYYRERMGVDIRADAVPVAAYIMERRAFRG